MDINGVNTFLRRPPTNASKTEINEKPFLKEQDRFLPIANVSKIMKKDLPCSAKIAKEAKECIQECASEFISFISSEAAENCQKDKRKTINAEDILIALMNLGFDNYVQPLQSYLQRYRETNKFEHGPIDIGGGCCPDRDWAALSAQKEHYGARSTNLSIPKLISLLPLTDLTSNNLNLEGLLRDLDFQRAIHNHLKLPSIDEDDDCMEEVL